MDDFPTPDAPEDIPVIGPGGTPPNFDPVKQYVIQTNKIINLNVVHSLFPTAISDSGKALINYLNHTPENTNPNVLRSLLRKL